MTSSDRPTRKEDLTKVLLSHTLSVVRQSVELRAAFSPGVTDVVSVGSEGYTKGG